MKEITDHFTNFIGAFEIREMPAVSWHGKVRSGKRIGDMSSTFYWDDVTTSMNEQGRNIKLPEFVKQIIFICPWPIHENISSPFPMEYNLHAEEAGPLDIKRRLCARRDW